MASRYEQGRATEFRSKGRKEIRLIHSLASICRIAQKILLVQLKTRLLCPHPRCIKWIIAAMLRYAYPPQDRHCIHWIRSINPLSTAGYAEEKSISGCDLSFFPTSPTRFPKPLVFPSRIGMAVNVSRRVSR